VLGPRRAFLAMMLYLTEGALGMPVFSGGAAGLARLVGPSGGYLVAFPFAAAATGALAARGWDRRPVTMFLAMLLGSTIVFAVGLAQLARFVPAAQLLNAGLLPFVPGDLLKSALAAGLFPATWALVRRAEGDR
jgi:biotin transport system substrate-specific component